jgi:hypothetical protein
MVFQRDSYRNPNGVRAASARTPGRGMGTGSGSNDFQKSRTREEIESWIDSNLPGESYHADSAVRFHLKKLGRPVTADSVREGLKERGWLKEQNS